MSWGLFFALTGTPFGAVFDVLPVTLPFAAPSKGALTNGADFGGQVTPAHGRASVFQGIVIGTEPTEPSRIGRLALLWSTHSRSPP